MIDSRWELIRSIAAIICLVLGRRMAMNGVEAAGWRLSEDLEWQAQSDYVYSYIWQRRCILGIVKSGTEVDPARPSEHF
jgi:hypothetical protein